MAWNRGTATFTSGSNIVKRVTGPAWSEPLNGVSVGREIRDSDGIPYEIIRVDDDDTIAIYSNYSGATGNQDYAIPTSPGISVESMALQHAKFITWLKQLFAAWQQLTIGEGVVTITDPVTGESVQINSVSEWNEILETKIGITGDYTITGAKNFTGTINVPDSPAGDSSGKAANTKFVTSALLSSAGELSESIDEINSSITTISSDVNTAKSDITTIKGNVTANTTAINNNAHDIGVVSTFATDTETRVKATETAIATKASKGANADITSLSGLTTPLSVAQGGTGGNTQAAARTGLGLGGAAVLSVGTAAGTVAAGNDGRFGTLEGKTGGTVRSEVVVNGVVHGNTFRPNSLSTEESGNTRSIGINFADVVPLAATIEYYLVAGQYHSLRMLIDSATYSFRGTGVATAVSWQSTSDSRLKEEQEEITDSLSKLMQLTGKTYKLYGMEMAGLIAQDVDKVMPEAVAKLGEAKLPDGSTIYDALALDYNAITALHVNATKEIAKELVELKILVEGLTSN
ncbi:putative chaperone of endosialidase [Dickeya phage Sucellus]|nr:putative chaperone of endosialidase [Dickeya phage Sucellus]